MTFKTALVRSHDDWLVVELTMADGVNAWRFTDPFRATQHCQARFEFGGWYVLALYAPGGACIRREWR